MIDTINFYFNWIPSTFNVIGCEYSTDIDIIIPVPNQQIIQDYRNKKFVLNLDLVKNDLADLGFNLITRELDVNLVYIEPKTLNIIDSLIGEPKLTQNIIYYTYKLHPQIYPPIISNQVQIDLGDFTKLFGKIILDWMEKLLGKTRYKELRPTKGQVYSDIILRLEFSFQILGETNFIELFNHNKNIVKSIGMKLAQIILLYYDELAYTKKTISSEINKILPIDYDNMIFILSRGKLGQLDNLNKIQQIFDILVNQYKLIFEDIKLSYKMNEINVSIDEYLLSIDKPDFIINEFIKSPEIPTPELANFINNQYQQTLSLNQLFIIKSFGINKLPTELLNHICIEDQRSHEWIELLKFYKCGNSINNTIKFIDCETNFNLIRGCVGEKLVVDLIDWNELVDEDLRPVSKCICGLIVETKGLVNSIGIAPDLLLITKTNQIIPIEIKTIVSDPNIINKKFLREIKLASKQLDTSINLINQIMEINTFGLIVFCFIHNNQITIKYKKYYFKL